MKAIIYKMKNLIGSFILPRETFETWNYPEYIWRLQKERKMCQKSNLIYFFLKNPCRSLWSHNKYFKNIRFCDTNSFDTFSWQKFCYFWPVIDETR